MKQAVLTIFSGSLSAVYLPFNTVLSTIVLPNEVDVAINALIGALVSWATFEMLKRLKSKFNVETTDPTRDTTCGKGER